MISDTLIGALIAIVGIIIGSVLNYLLSIVVEKRKFKIQSMARYKDILMKIKVHSIELKYNFKGKKRYDSIDLLIELHKLKNNFYTFPSTKHLAEDLEIIIKSLKEINMFKDEYDDRKYNDFLNKIDEFGKKSIKN